MAAGDKSLDKRAKGQKQTLGLCRELRKISLTWDYIILTTVEIPVSTRQKGPLLRYI